MTKHTDSSRSTDSDSSAPNSPELTRLSGEQAEERTAREGRMDKEALRKKLEAMRPYTIETFHGTPGATFTYTISMCRCGLNKDVTDEQCGRCNQLDLLSECSRLASRVERLEIALRECEEVMILMRCNADLREPATRPDALRMAKAMKLAHEALKTYGAGAHAEEKE